MNATARSTQATPQWTLELDADRVAWLTFDKPGASANALSRAAMLELNERLAELEQLRPVGLVIVSGKSGFIAGADISEFKEASSPAEAVPSVRAAHAVMQRLEDLPFPTVAAINGYCLGGGLELALACRHRVCADDPKVTLGLPEVLLGINPGFGGTVRSVRLVGVVTAMDMMLTGTNYRPDKALRVGLVDEVVPAGQLRDAAKRLALRPRPRRQAPLGQRLLNLPVVRGVVAGKIEQQVARRARREHYPAPYAIVDLWRRHGANPRTAYEAEAQSVARLVCTPTSRNLVRVFFLQERLKSLGGKDLAKDGHVHVVGAGVMGGDIAAWCAARGFSVTLQDRAPEFVQPALDRARAFFEKRARVPGKAAENMARLKGDVEGHGVARADVVIEAIFENAEAKRELYARLEPHLKPGAVLATNTSSLMLEPLSERLARPGRLVGLHFFNPVAQMPLVEVIESAITEPEARAAALAFTRAIDKLPLPCRSAPGFLVNRVLMPYMTEAMLAAQDGVPLARIDEAAVRFGMPVGPIELADVVGLDVCLHVGRILSAAFGGPAPDAVASLVAEGKLGKKSGRGLYEWRDGKAVKPPADATARVPDDLEDRLMLALVNEAMAVLREGVVSDADLLDAGVIFGSGFAPFRGGPLKYARDRGVAEVVARLDELAARHGERFRPDPGWPQFGAGVA
ncbi:MAG TPA: 3-hydroxyacyl-CoA dehydrogenase NAD-binding domain-containing protein [Steroidobacteraceae bacterium]|nr:3-hydroxyacyl-CoA dehydrogenase NAD-binding domain-containing protein [Steroidobacteraceae bacterium]